ncbi:auxin-induced protein [Kwoniella mangroviensis CBS 8886]|nr:auxin-induced protein [Kwoniella mangroviensis CBS 8886]
MSIPTQTIKHATIAGVQVPAMAIGTWSWGDKTWGYKPEQLPDIKEAWKTSVKAGLTFYDTAEAYGNGESEKIIGQLIQESSEEEKQKLFIATKFLPFPLPHSLYLFNPPVVERLQASLKRMGLSSVELYQIHSSSGLGSFESLASGLAQCVKMGLCKAVGVSNFSKDELAKFSDLLAKHDVRLASNQIEFNLLRQGPEKNGLLEEMKKRDIACLAYSPLAMGRLTGKYNASNPIPSGRRFSNQYTWEQLAPLLEYMKTLSEKYDVSISAIALNWVIAKGAIPLGGARNAKQAEQNSKALTFELTPEEARGLSEKGFDGETNWFWQRG